MLCHKHKCIFVHIPKTAGQSIEKVFLESLQFDESRRPELLLRPNNDPNKGPPRLAHLKAQDYFEYEYITKETFYKYFKFSFVRNPWDRAVSHYLYMVPERNISFEKFLNVTLKLYFLNISG